MRTKVRGRDFPDPEATKYGVPVGLWILNLFAAEWFVLSLYAIPRAATIDPDPSHGSASLPVPATAAVVVLSADATRASSTFITGKKKKKKKKANTNDDREKGRREEREEKRMERVPLLADSLDHKDHVVDPLRALGMTEEDSAALRSEIRRGRGREKRKRDQQQEQGQEQEQEQGRGTGDDKDAETTETETETSNFFSIEEGSGSFRGSSSFRRPHFERSVSSLYRAPSFVNLSRGSFSIDSDVEDLETSSSSSSSLESDVWGGNELESSHLHSFQSPHKPSNRSSSNIGISNTNVRTNETEKDSENSVLRRAFDAIYTFIWSL